MGEARLAKPWGPRQQQMTDRLLALGCGLEDDAEVFLQLGLSDELLEGLGTEGSFGFSLDRVRRRSDEHFVGHDASTLSADLMTSATASSEEGWSSPRAARTSP